MNTFFLSSVLIFMSFNGAAQMNEPLSWQVVYEFNHIYDTSLKDHPLQEKHQLLIGLTSSHYFKGTFIPVTRLAQAESAPSGPMPTVTGRPIAMVSDPFIIPMDVFVYPAQQKVAVAERIGIKNFMLEAELSPINWQVGSATKNILGYSCQQATCRFGGRTYTAWFTTDIPLPYGPWKLNGLPGLILEAIDDKKEVAFIATAINKGKDGQLTDNEGSTYITTNKVALNRARKAYEENPVATIQAQLSPGSPAPPLMFRDIAGKIYNGADAEAKIEKRANDMRKGLFNPLELSK